MRYGQTITLLTLVSTSSGGCLWGYEPLPGSARQHAWTLSGGRPVGDLLLERRDHGQRLRVVLGIRFVMVGRDAAIDVVDRLAHRLLVGQGDTAVEHPMSKLAVAWKVHRLQQLLKRRHRSRLLPSRSMAWWCSTSMSPRAATARAALAVGERHVEH